MRVQGVVGGRVGAVSRHFDAIRTTVLTDTSSGGFGPAGGRPEPISARVTADRLKPR